MGVSWDVKTRQALLCTISHTLQGCHFKNTFMLSYLPGTTQLWGTAVFQSCEKASGTYGKVIPRRALSSCFVIVTSQNPERTQMSDVLSGLH